VRFCIALFNLALLALAAIDEIRGVDAARHASDSR